MIVNCAFRGLKKSDINMILNSWTRSYLKSQPVKNAEWYFSAQQTLIMELIKKGQVLIACSPEDEFQILGYIVYDPDRACLHWLYVKNPFRRLGIGFGLLDQAFDKTAHPERQIACSHWSHSAKCRADKWNLIYDPRKLQEILKVR